MKRLCRAEGLSPEVFEKLPYWASVAITKNSLIPQPMLLKFHKIVRDFI